VLPLLGFVLFQRPPIFLFPIFRFFSLRCRARPEQTPLSFCFFFSYKRSVEVTRPAPVLFVLFEVRWSDHRVGEIEVSSLFPLLFVVFISLPSPTPMIRMYFPLKSFFSFLFADRSLVGEGYGLRVFAFSSFFSCLLPGTSWRDFKRTRTPPSPTFSSHPPFLRSLLVWTVRDILPFRPLISSNFFYLHRRFSRTLHFFFLRVLVLFPTADADLSIGSTFLFPPSPLISFSSHVQGIVFLALNFFFWRLLLFFFIVYKP